MRSSRGRQWAALMVLAAAGACVDRPATVLERLVEARQLTGGLLVQFTKAGDAANRSVMADTDEASAAFAHEAEQANEAVQRDAETLGPMLTGLGYSNEAQILEEFRTRFAQYRALDRTILALAVENTNLKAQRLSFGPDQEAAEAFRDALEKIAPPGRDVWRVKALAATSVAAVREIQALQAPHIAESDDVAMTALEKRMAASEAVARGALGSLASVVGPQSRPQLAVATAALDRFMSLNAQIVGLSRRNSNVRSLALSLGQKRTLTAACEESLQALQDALAKRGFAGTR